MATRESGAGINQTIMFMIMPILVGSRHVCLLAVLLNTVARRRAPDQKARARRRAAGWPASWPASRRASLLLLLLSLAVLGGRLGPASVPAPSRSTSFTLRHSFGHHFWSPGARLLQISGHLATLMVGNNDNC